MSKKGKMILIAVIVIVIIIVIVMMVKGKSGATSTTTKTSTGLGNLLNNDSGGFFSSLLGAIGGGKNQQTVKADPNQQYDEYGMPVGDGWISM